MANIMHHPLKGTRTRKVAMLFGFITTTTAGAIDSAASTNCNGFTVSRTSAGLYRLTLDDKYQSVLNILATPQKAAGGWVAGKGISGRIAATSIANGTIDVEFTNDVGVAADVTDGSVINFTVFLADSLLSR